ncbi:MAG TPA: TIM barrel protein [Polyangiaceae bacterium]|nr:TIM barrel protein [Polyangiaceae bacterium]
MIQRLRQSVSRWCFEEIALPDLCRAGAEMGLAGIDLLEERDWAIPKEFGLVCTMAYADGGSIPDGLNDPAHHDAIVGGLTAKIPRAARAGISNVITFFGNRRGMDDARAVDNCVRALTRVVRVAEDAGVTICVELLNSKVDHPDYQGDSTAFGVQVVEAVGSPRVKLLYDIYHMQIMEGDVVRTLREQLAWIGHLHTGGVPGRHEIDDSQEINYRNVCRAIAESGYAGYLAHEFVPKNRADPLSSLRSAVALCNA